MIEFTGCGIVPGVTRAQAVESDRDVPSEADVVVIGGSTDQAVAGMQEYIPAFAGCKVRERYTGSLMSTIDNLGVISPVWRRNSIFLPTVMNAS